MAVLVINPGSTSTKIGVFNEKTVLFCETVRHSEEELSEFGSIVAQKDYRRRLILDLLENHGVARAQIQGVIGIGGLLRPAQGGLYRVGQKMLDDLTVARYGEHAANLGALIAYDIAKVLGQDA
jgi:butyrate kinase